MKNIATTAAAIMAEWGLSVIAVVGGVYIMVRGILGEHGHNAVNFVGSSRSNAPCTYYIPWLCIGSRDII